METQKMPKNAEKYNCEKCHFTCNKKSNFEKHLLTTKHQMETFGNPKNAEKKACDVCNKEFRSKSGLWKHKKVCVGIDTPEETEVTQTTDNTPSNDDVTFKNMFIEMMKQNKELQNTLQTVIPKVGSTVVTNNTTNITNNHFNLNVFLNEQCKDALNIMDFVKSLHIQIADLESTCRLGFVEGTSKIIIDGVRDLDIHKRPIHCSDLQNQILYVKDNNMWKQDTSNKDTMKRAIDEISKANIKQLPNLIMENPMYANEEEYMKIVSNIMNMDVDIDKSEIISNVSKEVTLNRDTIIQPN